LDYTANMHRAQLRAALGKALANGVVAQLTLEA